MILRRKRISHCFDVAIRPLQFAYGNAWKSVSQLARNELQIRKRKVEVLHSLLLQLLGRYGPNGLPAKLRTSRGTVEFRINLVKRKVFCSQLQ